MIISFGTTCKKAEELGVADPLLTGIKTVTRRKWKQSHIDNLIKNIDDYHDAYSAAPYAKGKKIGKIKLTKLPYQQNIKEMTEKDLINEGNFWKTVPEFAKCIGCSINDIVWVIEFRFQKSNCISDYLTN